MGVCVQRERETDFNELAPVSVGTGKSGICMAGWKFRQELVFAVLRPNLAGQQTGTWDRVSVLECRGAFFLGETSVFALKVLDRLDEAHHIVEG